MKELYQNLLKVLDAFDNGNHLSKEDAVRMFGEERFAQMRVFVNTHKDTGITSGNWGFTKGTLDNRRAFRLYCQEMISKIEKDEYEQELRIKESLSNIDYNNVTRRISIGSAITAFLALIASILVPILLNRNDCHCLPAVEPVRHTYIPDTATVSTPPGLRDSTVLRQPLVNSSRQPNVADSLKRGASR